MKKGYLHDPQKKPYFWEEIDGDDERLLPRVHRVTSLLKRWYYGTYQGRVDKRSLQAYLDEFVFRFNRRTSGSRGLLFHSAGGSSQLQTKTTLTAVKCICRTVLVNRME